MTQTTSPVSVALLNFAGTFARRDPGGALLAELRSGFDLLH